MSLAALLLATALQGVSITPNPPDCAVYTGWLQDQAVRNSWPEHDDTIYVSVPFGFDRLSEMSRRSLVERDLPATLPDFLAVLRPNEQAERSQLVYEARRRERERLYALGIRGNDLLDQVADRIDRAFPPPLASIQPASSTLERLNSLDGSGVIECDFDAEIHARTTFVHNSQVNSYAWTNASSGERFVPDVGHYYVFSRVAFSEDRREAIIYVEYACGGLCGGGGDFYLMRRDDTGAWNVVGFLGDWIT